MWRVARARKSMVSRIDLPKTPENAEWCNSSLMIHYYLPDQQVINLGWLKPGLGLIYDYTGNSYCHDKDAPESFFISLKSTVLAAISSSDCIMAFVFFPTKIVVLFNCHFIVDSVSFLFKQFCEILVSNRIQFFKTKQLSIEDF